MTQLETQIYDRSARLLGEDVMRALATRKAIVFGVGGVGSWCAEGLLRSGLTHITIVDADDVSITNVNRQAMATTRTVGEPKVEAMKRHLLEINPDAEITAIQQVYNAGTADQFNLDEYDYIVDAVDSLKDKALLILNACDSKAKFYSSMGAALKCDPTRIRTAEFWDVKGCPLGAALRKRYKKSGILPSRKFTCVYDDEVLPNKGQNETSETDTFQKAQINGSLVHITAIFGLTISGLIIKDVYSESVSK